MGSDMDELTITRLCAEAMGYAEYPPEKWWTDDDRADLNIKDHAGLPVVYRPLHDDAQCMVLGKKFPELLEQSAIEAANHFRRSESFNLNSDLCRRVARMQSAKGKL